MFPKSSSVFKDRNQWSAAISEKKVISLGLNKVEGQTIHKKMPDFFPHSMI